MFINFLEMISVHLYKAWTMTVDLRRVEVDSPCFGCLQLSQSRL